MTTDIKLFRTGPEDVVELEGRSVALEKTLQDLIEKHAEIFLSVRVLASEYSTGAKHRGRIDSLAVDENGCPVIIEYKRTSNENVINQGLFYLDWLLDHKAEFEQLMRRSLGPDKFEAIEWSGPRLLCIAGDFTRYDEHAVAQINRNIELIRYRQYKDELLLLELVNSTPIQDTSTTAQGTTAKTKPKTVSDYLAQAPKPLQNLYDELEAFISSLGDDVQLKTLKHYIAFRRLKNFACVEIHPQSRELVVYVKVNPDEISLETGFSRDVRNVGHFGTGELEITICDLGDLVRAEDLLRRSYESS